MKLASRGPGSLLIPLALYSMLTLPGLGWGLPSARRSALYGAPRAEVVGSGAQRLFFTGPLQSYQVDECSLLMPLSRMDPRKLDFNPKWFHWGSLHLYTVGAALAGAHVVGLVTLSADRDFYLSNPEALRAVYLTARAVSWIMGLVTTWVLYAWAKKACGPGAGSLAACLWASAPLVTLYARFATVDMATAFWTTLAGFLAWRTARPSRRDLVASYAASGCAASVKFHGVLSFLLPWAQRPGLFVLGLAVAGAFFLLGTPYAVLDFPRFKSDLLWQWHHVRSGHGLAFAGTAPSLVHHLRESLFAACCPLAPAVCAVSILWAVRRSGPRKLLPFVAVFWFQLATSPLKFARYLLPVIPAHTVLAAWWASQGGRWVRGLLVGMCVWQALLSSLHAKVLAGPDVRDVAGTWLAAHGHEGDLVALPGRPYFATPPIARSVFSVRVVPLHPDSIGSSGARWYVLTDYDVEPVRRAPHLFPQEARAVHQLMAQEVHAFSTCPRLLRAGLPFLPHDMRYHCPTIWVVRLS